MCCSYYWSSSVWRYKFARRAFAMLETVELISLMPQSSFVYWPCWTKQARKLRITSLTDDIVDLGVVNLSLLTFSFVAGVLFGTFCSVYCFMRYDLYSFLSTSQSETWECALLQSLLQSEVRSEKRASRTSLSLREVRTCGFASVDVPFTNNAALHPLDLLCLSVLVVTLCLFACVFQESTYCKPVFETGKGNNGRRKGETFEG